jgi:hypothetical protein
MDQMLVRDIKRMYRSAREKRFFQPVFERRLAQYIQHRAPRGSVHWHKLRYEFRSIFRKCRDGKKPASIYLKMMTTLTKEALEGRHKKVELDVGKLKLSVVLNEQQEKAQQ